MVVVTDFKLHEIDKETVTKSVSLKLHLDTTFMTIALSTVDHNEKLCIISRLPQGDKNFK